MGDMSDWINTEYGTFDPVEGIEICFERILKETEKAYLILFDSSSLFKQKKEWIPKSQCELDEDKKEIFLPEWLALEKDLL